MEGGEIGELQDWEEVGLHSAGEEEEDEDGHVGHGSFSSIEAAAEGMIKHGYFSLENQARFSCAKSEAGSVESDNPSWIDPVSVSVYKDSGGFWSDSASDRSDDRKSYDFEARTELGFTGIEERKALLEHVDGNLGEGEEIGSLESSVSVELEANKELGDEEGAVEEVKAVAKAGGEEEGEKRMVLWWKVPLEVLKYCVFKVSPVWSFSVAAAVMGLVILGRRLYRMKRRSQSLKLKVAMDDKLCRLESCLPRKSLCHRHLRVQNIKLANKETTRKQPMRTTRTKEGNDDDTPTIKGSAKKKREIETSDKQSKKKKKKQKEKEDTADAEVHPNHEGPSCSCSDTYESSDESIQEDTVDAEVHLAPEGRHWCQCSDTYESSDEASSDSSDESESN